VGLTERLGINIKSALTSEININIINTPFIGIVIVVNLAMVMPASMRPDIDDPITASVDDAAVAGP
jgi:hypothetical protein